MPVNRFGSGHQPETALEMALRHFAWIRFAVVPVPWTVCDNGGCSGSIASGLLQRHRRLELRRAALPFPITGFVLI